MSWSSAQVENCLVSSEGNEWVVTGSGKVFVRDCYPSLFDSCQANFLAGMQGVFILGSPGIGKSVFLDYAFHRILIDLRQPVLFLSGVEGKAFLFTVNGEMESQKMTDFLDDPASLADQAEYILLDPPEDASKTNDLSNKKFRNKRFIVAMSPDENNCKKLRKDTRAKALLYMGTLSLPEALAMRSSCYPNEATEPLVRSRYEQIGGIARSLFAPLGQNNRDFALAEVTEKQKRSLQDIAENPIRIDGGEVSVQYKHIWSLYHLQPASRDGATDWTRYTIEPCSIDMVVKIRNQLMEKEVGDLWRLFKNTMEMHGTLRGIRYEAYAHKKILVDGIDGHAKSLTMNGEGSANKHVIIPPRLRTIPLPNNDLDEGRSNEAVIWNGSNHYI